MILICATLGDEKAEVIPLYLILVLTSTSSTQTVTALWSATAV